MIRIQSYAVNLTYYLSICQLHGRLQSYLRNEMGDAKKTVEKELLERVQRWHVENAGFTFARPSGTSNSRTEGGVNRTSGDAKANHLDSDQLLESEDVYRNKVIQAKR